jgi:signal transduction histidine kinase
MGTAIAQIDHAANVLRRTRDFLKRRSLIVSPVNVRSLVDETLLLARPEAEARGVMLDADLENAYLSVMADRVQLQQVLLNLIHNAVEARPEKADRGIVRITVERKSNPDRMEFAVADNGPGIPAKLRKGLFDPMRTSKREGLGLGLAICLTIVEAHRGRIWLHSGAPGATELRFWIPLENTGS